MHKLIIVDTETGGLDPTKYSILSLGAVVWEDGAIKDSFEVFIAEPELCVEPEAMAVNRIDIDWLHKHGLPPQDAVKKFKLFLDKNFENYRKEKISVAGHNVGFDISFIKRLYTFTDYRYEDMFSHRTLDTAGIIRFLTIAGKLQLDSPSSNAAFKYFNIPIEEGKRHSALADAMATADLLNHSIMTVNKRI